MKSLLLAAVLGVVGSGAVMAADLPIYSKAPAAAPAGYDWTGVYIGGHIGGGWVSTGVDDPSSLAFLNGCCSSSHGAFEGNPAGQSVSNSSFLGGLQAGANYQIGRLVLGSEFDYSWTKGSGSTSSPFIMAPTNAAAGWVSNETFGTSTNWIATATTRLGVARDTWLLYTKGGAAMTGGNYTLSLVSRPSDGTASAAGALSDTRIGWTVGTGLEWAFARNWTAKLEYDYLNFGSKTATIPVAGFNTANTSANANLASNLAVNVNQQISEVKLGINYKFDPGFLFW